MKQNNKCKWYQIKFKNKTENWINVALFKTKYIEL